MRRYLLDGKTYSEADCVRNGIDIADTLALTVVIPDHDPASHELSHVNATVDATALTYTLGLIEIERWACVDQNSIVQALSDSEQSGWAHCVLIPSSLRRHVQTGWLYDDTAAALTPPSLDALKTTVSGAAKQMAEAARNAIAQPTGLSEIGAWVMNYVGVALNQAGLPTPMWDAILVVESQLRSVSVDTLRQTHIEKAQNYHLLAGLTQGLAGKAALVSRDAADTEALLAATDALRAEALAAQRDPAAVIAKLLTMGADNAGN